LTQLALPLQLQDHAVFESFLARGNEQLLDYLTELAATAHGPGCWIWGPEATGKSHLLQALCARLNDQAIYLPLGSLAAAGTGIIEGLESRRFVCLDDIDAVAGDAGWECALFELCNALTDSAGILVVAADTAPRQSPIELPDLQSRLSRLPAFQVRPLVDADRVRALQLRARHRGLELPGKTANFLLSRGRRDMASLYRTLDKLDLEALKAKRRLTIPFVRETLGL